MTEVLSIPSNGGSQFGSPLRRSSSSTSFLLQHPPSYSRPTPALKSRYAAVGYDTSRIPATGSLPSSAPSSPRLTFSGSSNQPSYISTPSSSLSLDEPCQTDQEDEVVFPSYDGGEFLSEINDPAPASSPEALDSGAPSPSFKNSDQDLPLDVSSKPPPVDDDNTISHGPTRHVDYLSHNWKEEDIWASWRHIVSRKKDYSNHARLENASWRTWAKAKYQLQTVSPEALNWMKDHDVTWLYGPLQTGNADTFETNSAPPATRLSSSNLCLPKRPILKKRSLSELMLQRSLSTSTLMKQATDAVRAQVFEKERRDRPNFSANREPSDLGTCFEFGTPLTQTNTISTDPSTSSSGIQTPCTKRHIHFNNKVEQCIAINEEVEEHLECSHVILDDSDSDEEMLVMKPVQTPTKARPSKPNSPRGSFGNESKTIAMLPSTTLNYRGDTPEPTESEPRDVAVKSRPPSQLSSSSSQSTLRPSTPSANFLLDDDEDDLDMNWQPTSARRDSIYPRNNMKNDEDRDDDLVSQGLRRTPSGMFMPYDEEEEYGNPGILGKVVDTVNTAKDIAHVIWNVGWRR